jgi:predicted acylesterase/phospholipase RssA/CRP-like cAMP-binding protein
MSSENWDRLVDKVGVLPRWGDFSENFLRGLLAQCGERLIGNGECLVERGAEQISVFLILEGTIGNDDDARAIQGDILGQISLIEGRKWPTDLRAEGQVRALELRLPALRGTWRNFGPEMKTIPEFAVLCAQQVRLYDALRNGSLGSYLDEAAVHGLASVMTFRSILGGTEIFTAGTPSDSLLIVISGRVGVGLRDADGSVRLISEQGPGNSVGELGLVLDQDRQADVFSLRDSTVAMLDRGRYERLLTSHPVPIAGALFRMIYEHLRVDRVTRKGTGGTIALVPLNSPEVGARTALSLRDALSKFGTVTHITPAEGHALRQSHRDDDSLIAHLDELERRSDFLLYEAPNALDAWTLRVGRQADQVVFVAEIEGDAKATAIERSFSSNENLPFQRRSLLLVGPSGSRDTGLLELWRANRPTLPFHRIAGDEGRDFDRLARSLTDRRVGLVLGGGGARGFAHVGVLRALEEAKIPVDWVGGNSVGALIGAQYAQGVSCETILRQTRRFVSAGELPTLPLVSLFGGHIFRRGLQRIFGDVSIESLPVPFFCVSSNLSEACLEVHETGLLSRAIAASNSPPGLLPPIPHQGSLLVDGAVLDNVPADVMRERIGGGPLIAVDVNFREDMKVSADVTQLSAWDALKSKFRRDKGESVPGIAEILTRAGILGGLAQQRDMRKQVDHYLQPPVSEFRLMAYSRAEEIAEVSYQYTVREIESWAVNA